MNIQWELTPCRSKLGVMQRWRTGEGEVKGVVHVFASLTHSLNLPCLVGHTHFETEDWLGCWILGRKQQHQMEGGKERPVEVDRVTVGSML